MYACRTVLSELSNVKSDTLLSSLMRKITTQWFSHVILATFKGQAIVSPSHRSFIMYLENYFHVEEAIKRLSMLFQPRVSQCSAAPTSLTSKNPFSISLGIEFCLL